MNHKIIWLIFLAAALIWRLIWWGREFFAPVNHDAWLGFWQVEYLARVFTLVLILLLYYFAYRQILADKWLGYLIALVIAGFWLWEILF